MVDLSFGFFGVQIAYALQSANISRIFATLGADPHTLSFFWILPPLMDASKESTGCTQASNHWKIRVFDNNQQGNVENRPVYPQLEEWLDSLVSAPPVDEMWKGEKTENYISRMQKRSVTSLLRQADRIAGADEADTEETPEEKRIPLRFSEALQRNDPGQLPAFMAPPPEKQGAWRGTVIHRFLSIADLDKLREAGGNLLPVLQHMKEEMLTAGVFTEEEGAVIRPEDAAAWFGSPLGRRLLASPQLRREWGFNYFLPDRNLLVQGVIDCAFREGDGWILVDYKTDRVEDTDAFVALYRPQLKWYAEALRELSGLALLPVPQRGIPYRAVKNPLLIQKKLPCPYSGTGEFSTGR